MPEKYIGLLLAFFSTVGLGISHFLYKRSTGTIGPVNTTFYYYLFSLCIATVVWFFFREKNVDVAGNLLWPAFISASLFTSVLAFNYAVKYINVSVGATVRSLSFLVTVVLAVTFYRETLQVKDYVALVFATIAVVLFGLG